MKQEKNHKCTKLKGRIIKKLTLIWFEGTGKTIPFNSILEFSMISDFRMRNVIIWRWFIKNLMGTWRRNAKWRRCDVVTSHWRQYYAMCLLGNWPPLAPNILNLAPPPYAKPSYAYATVFNTVSLFWSSSGCRLNPYCLFGNYLHLISRARGGGIKMGLFLHITKFQTFCLMLVQYVHFIMLYRTLCRKPYFLRHWQLELGGITIRDIPEDHNPLRARDILFNRK